MLALVAATAGASAAQDAPQDPPTIEERLRILEEREAAREGAILVQDDLRVTLGGLLQARGTFYEEDLGARDSEFSLRRMRFEVGGELHERYVFNVEPVFSEDEVELAEAWVGADLGAEGPRLFVGRMKEPFGLEELMPRKHVDFPEGSLANQFMPKEDHGLTLMGRTAGGFLEYGAAFYNGTGGDDLNSDKDVAGRLAVFPFAGRQGSALEHLQVGVAATAGDQDTDVSGEELKTEARAAFLAFEPGSEIDGDRTRVGLEAAWRHGPFAVSGEVLAIDQEMTGTGGDADVAFDVWYLAASWVLTGEEKTWRGVRPDRPWVPGREGEAPGCGALQLAVRISELTLDDDLVSAGLVLPGGFPDSVMSADVGLNWYATANARLGVHWIHTEYEDPITLGGDTRDSEDALLVQLQLHF